MEVINHLAKLLLALIVLSTSGCGYVYDEPLVGPYHLSAIDVPEQMSIYYDGPGSESVGRVDQTVFSVGWNDKYIVAKQHPNNNRAITNFFYIIIARDRPSSDLSKCVIGPLTETEFSKHQKELDLPSFQQTIHSSR